MKSKYLITKNILIKCVFWSLPIIYTILYGPYGYDFSDQGWITGYSWRVFLGQIPYRDFYWGKPPFSLYFHALQFLIIPEQFQAIAERFLYYSQVVIYSYLFSIIIKNYFPNSLNKVNVYLLSTATFIYSAHNWAPFSWYTHDGIFFSTLGLYFLINWDKVSYSILGMFFAFLAALTKQSFYLIPIMMLFVSYFLYGKKRTLQLLFSLIVLLFLSLLIIYTNGISGLMLQNISSQTSIKDLILYGFFFPLEPPAMYISIGVIAFIISQIKYLKVFDKVSFIFLFVCLAFLVLTVKLGLSNVKHNMPSIWVDDDHGFFFGLFLVATFYVFYSLITNYNKKWIVLAGMLFISWSASISWGYNLPANFSGPFIFGSVLFCCKIILKDQVMISKSFRNTLFIFSVVGLVQFYILSEFVWKDSTKSELKYDLGEISHKLQFIKTDIGGYEKIGELFELHDKYGDNYTVIPSFLAAHYLTGTINPLPTDSESNSEYFYDISLLIDPIINNNIVVLIEKDELAGGIPFLLKNKLIGYKYGSDIMFWVMDNMEKIESTKHFDIYKGLK